MTVIAQDVFILAMNLMDEQSQDGTYNGYSDEYKNKSWPILTLLQTELLSSEIAPTAVTDPLSVLQLDDRTCLTTLPYGLAAHLLLPEDESKASFFNARYDELKGSILSPITTVQSVYNIDGYEQPQPTQPAKELDDGSFLEPDEIIYDGGEW
jgi:hypothetical protein